MLVDIPDYMIDSLVTLLRMSAVSTSRLGRSVALNDLADEIERRQAARSEEHAE